MADVFVSYATEDRERVKRIVESLERAGFSVWWDRRIELGRSFDREIERELEAAACVVVIWSAHSIESDWVRNEAQEGLERGVLLPVLIDQVRPPLAFRRAQTAQLIGRADPVELSRVAAAVESIAMSKPAAQPGSAAGSPMAENAIAVLPFANVSNDPDQEFFCNGIAEELINALVALGELDVIARSSSFQFNGRNEDVRKVASALGVRHILEGSVRKAGNAVRVTAQLIDGANGKHLWSERFDRDLTDIFAVQDEITAAIMEALRYEVGAGAPVSSHGGTENPRAYDAYLRGRYEMAARVNEVPAARRALTHVQEALALDPQFADAWGALAEVGFYLGYQNPDLEQLHHSIERALELDASQGSALRIQAALKFYEDYDAQEALNALAVIIRQRPSDFDALARFVWICSYLDQDLDYIQLCSRMIELDPLREVGYRCRALAFRRLDRQEEFLADARRALELGPDGLIMREMMVHEARETGDQVLLEDALKQYRALVGTESFLAEALEAEDRDATLKHLKARERSGGSMRILDAARAYAYLGDHDAAIARFRDYVGTSRSFLRLNFARNSLFQPLLRYPEYQELLATIGCDDATLARIQVPSIN